MIIILEHPAQPSTKPFFSFLSPRGIRCSACHWRSLWEFHGPSLAHCSWSRWFATQIQLLWPSYGHTRWKSSNGFKWGVILIQSSNPNQFVESNQVLCQFQGSLVTTSVRFDNMRVQILKQSVATEASYSQVRSLLISLRALAVNCFLCATSGESCSRKCPWVWSMNFEAIIASKI